MQNERALRPVAAERKRFEPPIDGLVARATAWLSRHSLARIALAVVALSLALVPAVGLLLAPDAVDGLGSFGLAGVFLANLAGTATLFVPVPGLTAAAQALIISQGEKFNPILVGVIGGAGMAAGEVTAYYAGMIASRALRGRDISGPRWFKTAAKWATGRINWLLGCGWGMATLFVLAAIPNPLFEVAGVTAGSVRMPFRRFFVAVTAGKVLRGIALAYLGSTLGFPSL